MRLCRIQSFTSKAILTLKVSNSLNLSSLFIETKKPLIIIIFGDNNDYSTHSEFRLIHGTSVLHHSSETHTFSSHLCTKNLQTSSSSTSLP